MGWSTSWCMHRLRCTRRHSSGFGPWQLKTQVSKMSRQPKASHTISAKSTKNGAIGVVNSLSDSNQCSPSELHLSLATTFGLVAGFLFLHLYALRTTIESKYREKSEKEWDTAVWTCVEDFLWEKHEYSTYKWEDESIECWCIVLVFIFSEEHIEVRLSEIDGSTEEESDEKCESLYYSVSIEWSREIEDTRESENEEEKYSGENTKREESPLRYLHGYDIPDDSSDTREDQKKGWSRVRLIEYIFGIVDRNLGSLDWYLPEASECYHEYSIAQKKSLIKLWWESEYCRLPSSIYKKEYSHYDQKKYHKIYDPENEEIWCLSDFWSDNRTKYKKHDKYHCRTSTDGRRAKLGSSNLSSDKGIFPNNIEWVGKSDSYHSGIEEERMN